MNTDKRDVDMTVVSSAASKSLERKGLFFPENELLRYFLASGFALAVDFGTLVFLTELFGVHYLISAAFGFLLGLVSIYLLSIHWVFTTRRVKKTHHEALIFAMIGIGGLGINELGLYLLTDVFGQHYTISKLLVTGLVFSWNFGIRKILLFR